MLASAAILGATSGVASAQTPVPAGANMMVQQSQGQIALPWAQGGGTSNNNNNSYGQPNSYVGQAAFPKNAVPTPGTVVIRLNGRVEVDMMAQWSPNNETFGNKTNPISFGSYMRLYPGVDGMAANGLRYGASIELRENFPGRPGSSTPALSPTAPSPSDYSSGQTVYVRRAFTYLASDNVGIVRFGQTDGVVGLFDPGIFYGSGWDAGLGNINGGPLLGLGVSGAAVPYVFMAGSGTEYGNNKIVYMTPQFFGFDFGVQYAPSMGNSFSSCTSAGATCNNATTGTDATRWYNQVGAGVRWQGSIGPVALGVFGFYETAGKESFFGPSVGAGRGVTGNKFDNLSFYQAAGYAAFDTGIGTLTWNVDYIGGATNGPVTMRPTGGAVQNAITSGLVYRNGPISLGAQYEVIETQGAAQLTGISQRHEYAILFGGSYNIAPGMYLVGEYAYTSRHQGGYDFVAGSVSTGSGTPGTAGWKAGATRDTHSNGVLFATVMVW